MGKEDLFKKRRIERQNRKENNRKLVPYRYLIVCEGKKTEPNYFEGLKQKIEGKYRDKIDIRNIISLDIEGTGRNTEDLVNYVEIIKNKAMIEYGHIWVVFDKDDFEQFDNAIKEAEDRGYKVGWSNECIELWFLLHFQNLDVAINRGGYYDKLTEHFKKNKIFERYGLYNKNYEDNKNFKQIFEVLIKNVEDAIRRSKKLLELHKKQGIIIPSKMKPATKVFELVEELLEYLKD